MAVAPRPRAHRFTGATGAGSRGSRGRQSVAVPGGAAWLPPTHVGGYGVGSGCGKAGLRIDTRAGASDSPPSHFMAEPKENVLMEKIVSLCKPISKMIFLFYYPIAC